MVALDAFGHELLLKIGDPDQVTFTADELERLIGRVDTVIHNLDNDSPFWIEDYAFATVIQPREMVVFGMRIRWRLLRGEKCLA